MNSHRKYNDEGQPVMSTNTRNRKPRHKAPKPVKKCELCQHASEDPEVVKDASEGGPLPPYYLCVNVPDCDLRVRVARRRELLQDDAGESQTVPVPAVDAGAAR